ncbi:hypothetical protein FPQ18DRAFT_301807 [Pyronema domesticum]|uniref:Uncharacterized protein n=1 Tax=Pyronema omphalodes (strain CBS 100304) TaxID=1076935 RepID=U4L0C8_PYROM|nr:hypothetical protein FPQ18DRAFT_301807 [Pyronema domesticum]CCX08476.1 Similar to hypothetical protein VDAG_00621 [Verticillium dahliae VdLs.17]; acc. no. EGY13939 [Pyronema omphalodes CBS 100304]
MQFNLLTLALLASTITDLPLISSTKSTPAEGSKISTISDSNIPKFYSSIPQSEDISKIMLPHDSIVAARTDKGKWYEGKYEGPGTPYDDGKWHEGKYEGPGTGYNNGQYHPHPRRDTQMKQDDGKWYEGKYEGPNTPYNNGQYQPKKHSEHEKRDADQQYDNGKWHEGKYEGPNTPYNNGKYPAKYQKRDDGQWHEGKYEGPGTEYSNAQWIPHSRSEARMMGCGMRENMKAQIPPTTTENTMDRF